MTTSTLTLSAFLLARIEEDEAEAREYQSYQVNVYEAAGWWDCDRVLAECEVKRRIVEQAQASARVWGNADADNVPDAVTWGIVHEAMQTVLRALVQPYAAHPDYRPEWRP